MSVEPIPQQVPSPYDSRPMLAAVEAPGFSATRTVMPGEVHVALAGELDLATVPIADREIRQAQDSAHNVQLDLGALTFIDAAGLGMVMAANLRAREVGSRLAVVYQRSLCVRRLFELIEADRALDVVDGPAAAPARRNGTRPSPS